MNARDWLPLLGKTADHSALAAILTKLGARPPKLRHGEDEAFVDLPTLGVVLVFEATPSGKRAMLLTSVQLYAGLPNQDCSKFAGELPEGLRFEDTRDAVRKKLGRPDMQVDASGVDTWSRDDHELIIEYRIDLSGIRVVHCAIADD